MKIVVDLFSQHSGDMIELERMALAAWLAGADAVKVQLFKSETLWGDSSREYLEMSRYEFKEFVKFCSRHGIETIATPFDDERFSWIRDEGLTTTKIASRTVAENKTLCELIIDSGMNVMISCGAVVDQHLESFKQPFGKHNNVKYLFCVPQYPTFYDNPALRAMPKTFGRDKPFQGFSDHVVGTTAAIIAALRGAIVLEKHFTLGTSLQRSTEKAHLCSLTPDTLRELKNVINNVKSMQAIFQ